MRTKRSKEFEYGTTKKLMMELQVLNKFVTILNIWEVFYIFAVITSKLKRSFYLHEN